MNSVVETLFTSATVVVYPSVESGSPVGVVPVGSVPDEFGTVPRNDVGMEMVTSLPIEFKISVAEPFMSITEPPLKLLLSVNAAAIPLLLMSSRPVADVENTSATVAFMLMYASMPEEVISR